jgi:formylglycine-generating enzyme required for sulfatase activity
MPFPFPFPLCKSREDTTNLADMRIIRGGSWFSDVSGIHAANRGADDPNIFYNVLGFRCARSYQ